MPIKINTGLCRKVGEPNYGSRGASINIEMELDGSLIQDPDRLKERIRHMYALARNSVEEELRGAAPSNGHHNGTAEANGNLPRATASQVKAIHAIAKRIGIDLTSHLRQKFQVVEPGALTLKQASSLIDELKNGGSR